MLIKEKFLNLSVNRIFHLLLKYPEKNLITVKITITIVVIIKEESYTQYTGRNQSVCNVVKR